MANDNEITIEVAYGTAEQQRLYRFRLPANSTARQAALAAPVLNDFPEAQPHTAPLGIFGKAVKDSHILREGDRVEIFGDHLPAETLAQQLDTIPYEVLTSVSQRVKRVFFQ